MSDFITLVSSNGPLGLAVGALVLLGVYALTYSGVTVKSDHKRAANVILSVLLSGLEILDPQEPQVLVAAIASVFSALVYELIQYLGKKKAEAKSA